MNCTYTDGECLNGCISGYKPTDRFCHTGLLNFSCYILGNLVVVSYNLNLNLISYKKENVKLLTDSFKYKDINLVYSKCVEPTLISI